MWWMNHRATITTTNKIYQADEWYKWWIKPLVAKTSMSLPSVLGDVQGWQERSCYTTIGADGRNRSLINQVMGKAHEWLTVQIRLPSTMVLRLGAQSMNNSTLSGVKNVLGPCWTWLSISTMVRRFFALVIAFAKAPWSTTIQPRWKDWRTKEDLTSSFIGNGRSSRSSLGHFLQIWSIDFTWTSQSRKDKRWRLCPWTSVRFLIKSNGTAAFFCTTRSLNDVKGKYVVRRYWNKVESMSCVSGDRESKERFRIQLSSERGREFILLTS